MIQEKPMNSYYKDFFNKLGINTSLLNMLHVGISISNKDGIMIFVNDAFRKMYEFGDMEIVGMAMKDFFLTCDGGINQVMETGKSSS